MAVLPRNYLDCVFHVYPDRLAAEKAENAGGTGFIAGRLIAERKRNFLVTNRHVIESMDEPHIRINTREGKFESIRIPKSSWRHHEDGDDISAAPIDLSLEKYQVASIFEDAFITPRIIETYNIGLGNDVVVLGRFSSQDGEVRNMPSARFGHISMLPSDPIENKFGHKQETFIAEYFSIAGYSGSPVFAYLPNNVLSETGLTPALGPWLLGINWMHFQWRERIDRINRTSSISDTTVIHTGMSGVIPAWRIAQLISRFDFTPAIQVVSEANGSIVQQSGHVDDL